VESTLGYCGLLRHLIREMGVGDIVGLLVESETVAIEDLHSACGRRNGHRPEQLTPEQHENVERFLGRSCDAEEALARSARYADVTSASERMLARHIDGVHMTQRASPSTLCFRPFPGGDSRIQSGEVALRNGDGHALRPILLTSRNLPAHVCLRDPLTGVLPKVIPHVTYVERVAD
jgi:hypothetical protein